MAAAAIAAVAVVVAADAGNERTVLTEGPEAVPGLLICDLRNARGALRLALAAWYQGERAVRRRGVYEVTKPFVADVLALRARM